MQEYRTCRVKQTYVYVEEDNFMKGDPFYYDGGSSVQMMNQCTPTPPHNHHAQPHHGGFDKDFDDSWKMDTTSHGGGWSSDEELQHQHTNRKMNKPSHGGGGSTDKEWKTNKPSHRGSKYENSNDMYHSKMGGGGGGNGGYHHVWNEPVNYYSDDCNPRYYYPEQKSRYWMSKEIDEKPGQYWMSKGIED